MKRVRMIIPLLVVVVTVLVACKPAPTPEVVKETVEVPVEQTVVVEATPEPTEEPAEEEKIKIVWWSHWAEETNKRNFIEQVIADYTAEHPNVEIEVVWWQKQEMFNAIQNTSVAGEGFPDMFYIDRTAPQISEAGWTADLSDGVNWDNIEPWSKVSWTWPSGEVYAMPLEACSMELYINAGAFAELGIEIPEDRQFTADEFMEVARTCKEGGYDVFAGGMQWWGSGALPFWYALEHTMGVEEFTKYFNGELPIDTPEARAAIEWAYELVSLPAYGDSYATNTIAEAHQDLHTKESACMFPVGSWYTGRAFVPPEEGGQPPDFELSCIRYPAMPGGVANDEHLWYVGGSLAAHEMSPNKDVAIDVINFIVQEKYGNLWYAMTGVQTGIKTNLDTMPATDFDWYFEEFDSCKAGAKGVPINVFSQPAEFRATWIQIFNEGLVLGVVDVDEALEQLEAARP